MQIPENKKARGDTQCKTKYIQCRINFILGDIPKSGYQVALCHKKSIVPVSSATLLLQTQSAVVVKDLCTQ
jgi:hypothetical protein